VSKETYYSVKRDLLIGYTLSIFLLQCQKRPTTVSKETYYSVKRDLLIGYTSSIFLPPGTVDHLEVCFVRQATGPIEEEDTCHMRRRIHVLCSPGNRPYRGGGYMSYEEEDTCALFARQQVL